MKCEDTAPMTTPNILRMNKRLREKIDRIQKLLIKEVEPEKIILFGSLAKKMPKAAYDIDIFIYKSKSLSHREERKLKEKVDELAGIYSVDIIFSGRVEKDFQKLIENTGVAIYEKSRS